MTTIHLLDAVFSHDVGSVAGKPPSYFTWNRLNPGTIAAGPAYFDGLAVLTDGYVTKEWASLVGSTRKIGWLREPQCLWPGNYEAALDAADHFDFILTYYQPLLDARPDKFRFAPYGGSWLPRQTWGIKPKTRNISMLIGSKMSTDGHRLRHDIYQALQDNGLADQVDFYGIHGVPVEYGWQTKYKVLADYRYAIVTETCRQDNLFTEILLDCLMMGTIPIFWGCPNSYHYFSDVALWQFQDIDGLLYLARLAKDYASEAYLACLEYIYGNMQKAMPYEITEDWLWHTYFKEMV